MLKNGIYEQDILYEINANIQNIQAKLAYMNILYIMILY